MMRLTAKGHAIVALLLLVTPAAATMPQLGPKPEPRTPAACANWARIQVTKGESDIGNMWGLRADGTSSERVAVDRLTRNCLRKPISELEAGLISFGAAAGHQAWFCRAHPRLKICRGVEVYPDYFKPEAAVPKTSVWDHPTGTCTVQWLRDPEVCREGVPCFAMPKGCPR